VVAVRRRLPLLLVQRAVGAIRPDGNESARLIAAESLVSEPVNLPSPGVSAPRARAGVGALCNHRWRRCLPPDVDGTPCHERDVKGEAHKNVIVDEHVPHAWPCGALKHRERGERGQPELAMRAVANRAVRTLAFK
jgi:hypothetical protein